MEENMSKKYKGLLAEDYDSFFEEADDSYDCNYPSDLPLSEYNPP